MPQHDFEGHVLIVAEKAGEQREEAAFVHGVDAAHAQLLFVAGGGVDLLDEALFQIIDAEGIA